MELPRLAFRFYGSLTAYLLLSSACSSCISLLSTHHVHSPSSCQTPGGGAQSTHSGTRLAQSRCRRCSISLKSIANRELWNKPAFKRTARSCLEGPCRISATNSHSPKGLRSSVLCCPRRRRILPSVARLVAAPDCATDSQHLLTTCNG